LFWIAFVPDRDLTVYAARRVADALAELAWNTAVLATAERAILAFALLAFALSPATALLLGMPLLAFLAGLDALGSGFVEAQAAEQRGGA
jgi:hypothetical protein